VEDLRLEPAVPKDLLRSLLQAGLLSALPVEAIFKSSGVDLARLQEMPDSVALSTFETIAEAMIAASPDHGFALRMGQLFSFESMGDLGVFILSGSTGKQVIDDFSQFKYLLMPVVDVVIRQSVDADYIEFQSRDHTPVSEKTYYVQAVFSAILKFCYNLLGDRSVFHSVSFKQHVPENAECFHDVFGDKVTFSALRNELVFKPGVLARALPSACPSMHQETEQRLRQKLMERRQQQSLAGQVYQIIREGLQEEFGAEQCQLDIVAARLGFTERTLQRKLKCDDTSFVLLKEQCQRQLAERWLADQRYLLDDIATRLGFSERTAFSRAFKRWTGFSPSEYKKRPSNC
jgi:AraC-like DNA-binding protein